MVDKISRATPLFNPEVERLAPPPVPAVQAWARAYDLGRGPLIDLSQAVPGYPPHPDLLKLLSAAAGSPELAGYGPIEGERALREAYALHQREVYQAGITAENIHITSGCNQAFVVATLAVAGRRAEILLTDPCYFNHETSLAMLGITPRYVSCRAEDGFLPSPEAVSAAITPHTRALAIVSPNNPTGAVYPPELIETLFELCRQRGVWLIVDETYRDFLPPAQERPHDLNHGIDWRDGLIGLYSFSKSFCIPGHRLGAITGPASLIEQASKIMDNLQICAPRAPQSAVAQALPALSGWRGANRREIYQRSIALRETLASCSGWEPGAIGAYFAFVRHPFKDLSSIEAARLLASHHGVVTIPGAFFGKANERYLRFAFANADAATIRTLASRLPLAN